MFAQKITTEALIHTLKQSFAKRKVSSRLIHADELSVFLGRTSDTAIMPVLTTLYDSKHKWDYVTIKRGTEKCDDTYINLIGGSTPQWLKESMPRGSVGGGFTGRIVFVYQDTTDRTFPRPTIPPDEAENRMQLIQGLREIHELKGEMEFTDEGGTAFDAWYYQLYDPDKGDTGLGGYMGRKHDTLLKVATIISVARDNNMLLHAGDFDAALDLMNANEKKLPEIISIISASESGEVQDRVLNTVLKHPGITHAKLLRYCYRFVTASELNLVMDTLTQSGLVELGQEKRRAYYAKGR